MPPPPMPANLDPTTVSSHLPSSSPHVFTSKLLSLPSLSGAQTSDPPASPSSSTPFANLSLLSPTASYSSNSSPLSPKLSTLTSSFLSITPTLALSPDADPPGAIQMDVDKDLHDSDATRHRTRSPSLRPLSSSEPLRRLRPPLMSREESPNPTHLPAKLHQFRDPYRMPSQRHHLHPPFVQNQKPSPAHPRKQRLSLRLTSPRSRRPLQDATRTATSSVVSNSNGVLQRLSGMDSTDRKSVV